MNLLLKWSIKTVQRYIKDSTDFWNKCQQEVWENTTIVTFNDRSSPLEVLLGKRILKLGSKFTEEHPCRSLISIKVAKQVYWNHISAWVFSCKFAAYFQNTFSLEQLWRTASVSNYGTNYDADSSPYQL